MADGVVVGSALVEILGREGVGAARRFLGTLREALDRRDDG
jgi:tryptophan synthase alpha subunit